MWAIAIILGTIIIQCVNVFMRTNEIISIKNFFIILLPTFATSYFLWYGFKYSYSYLYSFLLYLCVGVCISTLIECVYFKQYKFETENYIGFAMLILGILLLTKWKT